jgi:SAM-dependent methyltransferase
MPFADDSFDLVTSWMALSDMSSYPNVIKEFSRVVCPGGRLVFCVRHPSYFTRSMRILRNSEKNPAGLLVGEYFDNKPWVESWSFAGSQDAVKGRSVYKNLRFPFTLAHCINGVLESGLNLCRIEEPVPDTESCIRYPRLEFWSRHAALYLFVSAIKPS